MKYSLDDSIKKLELTARAENCLMAEGIITIRDLVKQTAGSLLKIPNLGNKSVSDIKDALIAAGFYPKKGDQDLDLKISLEAVAKQLQDISAQTELNEIKASSKIPELTRRIEMLEATYNKMSGLYAEIYKIREKLEKVDRMCDQSFLDALRNFTSALDRVRLT